MIHVMAIITAKPGQREAVLEHMHANIPAVRAEEGCVQYEPVIDAPDGPPNGAKLGPDTFCVVERWETMAALQAHAASAHMKAYGAKTKELIANRAVHVLTAA